MVWPACASFRVAFSNAFCKWRDNAQRLPEQRQKLLYSSILKIVFWVSLHVARLSAAPFPLQPHVPRVPTQIFPTPACGNWFLVVWPACASFHVAFFQYFCKRRDKAQRLPEQRRKLLYSSILKIVFWVSLHVARLSAAPFPLLFRLLSPALKPNVPCVPKQIFPTPVCGNWFLVVWPACASFRVAFSNAFCKWRDNAQRLPEQRQKLLYSSILKIVFWVSLHVARLSAAPFPLLF